MNILLNFKNDFKIYQLKDSNIMSYTNYQIIEENDDNLLKKRLYNSVKYLDRKGYKFIKIWTYLKKCSPGIELAFISREGYLYRYRYLIDFKNGYLKYLLSDFKTYITIDTSSIHSIYASNIYMRKIPRSITTYSSKYPIFIDNYLDPIYYADNKFDAILYKQGHHYRQVSKHIQYFGDI